jgi:general secretion pathway protein E
VRVTSLIKILCDIDISEKRIVQEGHYSARVPDRRVDYRVSFAPAMFGQKCVIRVLDTANTPYHVWDLQLPEWMFEEIQRAMKADSGMFLVCGPTGSGKTSTLYAVIRDIDVSERNVVTSRTRWKSSSTASRRSRSTMRREQLQRPSAQRPATGPDAILVGEVRRPGNRAHRLQAAITGHLVFSTVHSKTRSARSSACSTSASSRTSSRRVCSSCLAQRLVRKLCPAAASPQADPEIIGRMGKAGEGVEKIYNPRGCPKCVGTGFMGRPRRLRAPDRQRRDARSHHEKPQRRRDHEDAQRHQVRQALPIRLPARRRRHHVAG